MTAATWNRVADIELTVAGALALGFVVVFFFGSDWRRTRPGRAVMYLAVSITAILGQFCASRWLGQNYAGRTGVRVVLYGAVMSALAYLLVTVLIEQRRRGPAA